MKKFQQSINEHFPGALSEPAFVEATHKAVSEFGFDADNTIACVGVCRDELCRSLVWSVRDTWGEAFNFSSLGGMLTLGTAGFRAAHAHAPIVDGRERYIYVVMPHIGIDSEGVLGKCLREGRHGTSSACGALNAMLAELNSGAFSLSVDQNNIEYSILKQNLTPRLLGPDLHTQDIDIKSVTMAMSNLITEELEHMIELTVDTEIADYAVFTGVQVHQPVEGSMIWSNRSYACVRGERRELTL